MDIIWAPWRMAYIENADSAPKKAEPLDILPDGEADCFLCQAAVAPSGQELDRYIIRRTPLVVSLLNRYPYNNGHLLVAPKRHIADLSLLTPEEWSEISAELTHWTSVIRKTMNADGFNIGLNLGRVAGAGLPGHLHWHIVPRWNGDTNFITTIGSTKAIPQSLQAVCELLRKHA